MKKFPKLVQADKRGQIVIPKDVRKELNIDENTGFYVYVVPGEGIILKQVEPGSLKDSNLKKELDEHADEVGVDKNNVDKAAEDYNKKGGLEKL